MSARHGICEQTLYRWKAKYNGIKVSDVRRLKQLLAEATLDNQALMSNLTSQEAAIALHGRLPFRAI